MAEVIGKAVGHAANGTLKVLDVDGVVRQVDINDVLERIDWDELMTKIDMNKVIDSVDVNRHLDRVDIDRIMKRVDINDVVLRSNVPAILAHSTTGIFGEVLDSLRKQVILFDLWLMDVASWLRHFRVDHHLPPGPLKEEGERPEGTRTSTAVAIQGCYTGIFSKGLAIFLDNLIVTFSFAALLVLVEVSWMILAHNDSRGKLDRKNNIWVAVAFCGYWLMYFLLTVLLTGRTIGMGVVGIKVVDKHTADSLTFTQAFVRTLLLPLSSTFVMFLGLIGFFRRDGRMLHDIVAKTGIIYKWNAGMANLSFPEKTSNEDDDSPRASLLGNEISNDIEATYSTF